MTDTASSVARGGPGGEAPRLQNRLSLRPFLYELKIQTKEREVKRLGDVINYAQEDFITEVERQINENGEVRIIVLKARQIGISTIIEAIIFALSILFKGYQGLIISHEKDSAEHILTMTKRYWTTYSFKDFHDEQYNGRTQLAWSDLQSNIVVATAKNVGAGRSKTLHALHASEVAFWDAPETLATGLRQSIPSVGLTMIFLESTANGIGNYFHKSWEEATGDKSEFVPKFYPWHQHPEYTADMIPRAMKAKFSVLGPAATKDEAKAEKALRAMGIGDERLLWRRWAIQNLCQGDVTKFNQEYPTTPNEAFLTTGRNVFNINNLLNHYVPMRPRVGNLHRHGNTVRFVEDSNGILNIYRFPAADKNWGIYQIGADPTHAVAGDQACAHVLNRRTLEQAAVLAYHTNPIEFAEQLDLLGRFYNLATIAPEKEGPGYATVGHLLGRNYPRVWESQKTDKTPGKIQVDVYGWGTNKATKPQAIGHLVNALGQPLQRIGETTYGLLIHDEETFKEMKDYISDEKGGYENGSGSPFDDRVMALGIALATHYIDPPVPAYEPDQGIREMVKEVKAGINHETVTATAQNETEPPPAPWEQWDDNVGEHR